MGKKPLKATDKRRNASVKAKHGVQESESSGSAEPLAELFNDRRTNLGHGKRAN